MTALSKTETPDQFTAGRASIPLRALWNGSNHTPEPSKSQAVDSLPAVVERYLAAGLSIIPVAPGTKKPPTGFLWKTYQSKRMTTSEARQYFVNGCQVALVCGAISGNLEVVDFDNPELFRPFFDMVEGINPELRGKLTVWQQTPNGYHLILRCSGLVGGNRKLATSARYQDDQGRPRQDVFIETRGEGGYSLVDPSKGYTLHGSLEHLPVLTPEERDLLHAIAKSFDETEPQGHQQPVRADTSTGDRPGDVFNREADWQTLLEGEGWAFTKTVGDRQHFTRPGKTDGSTSATLNGQGFFCFSTSTPLPVAKPLDRFAFYAYSRHGGDFKAAARELSRLQSPATAPPQQAKATSPVSSTASEQGAEVGKPAAKTTRGFELTKLSAIRSGPTDWLVLDFLEPEVIALLFGDSASGKSFMAVDLVCSLATGHPWHGRPVKQGPVVYLCGEGQRGLRKRFLAWGKHHGVDIKAVPIFISNMAPVFSDSTMKAPVAAIDAIAAKYGNPVLIVVDTLSRAFLGDENSTSDMTAFIRIADELKFRFQSTILLLHHVGHAYKDRPRGAYALPAGLDFSYRLERGLDGIVRMVCLKAKDHELMDSMAFRTITVDLSDSPEGNLEAAAETSLVLEAIDFLVIERGPATGRGKNQAKALEVLRSMVREHQGNLEDGGFDATGARVTVPEWRDACIDNGLHKSRFHEAKNRLEQAGRIQVENGFVRICD